MDPRERILLIGEFDRQLHAALAAHEREVRVITNRLPETMSTSPLDSQWLVQYSPSDTSAFPDRFDPVVLVDSLFAGHGQAPARTLTLDDMRGRVQRRAKARAAAKAARRARKAGRS